VYKIRAVYPAQPDYRFDQDYYVRGHLPLAQRQLQGKVTVKAIDIEWDVKVLLGGEEITSPCAVSIYLETDQDLQDFQSWLQSPDAQPVVADQANYTNCECHWTIAKTDTFAGF